MNGLDQECNRTPFRLQLEGHGPSEEGVGLSDRQVEPGGGGLRVDFAAIAEAGQDLRQLARDIAAADASPTALRRRLARNRSRLRR